ADRSREELAGRLDGLALGVGRLRSDGSELPEDHGPSAALDAQSPSGTVIDGRKSWRCDEGRVDDELSGRHRSFNYERGNANIIPLEPLDLKNMLKLFGRFPNGC